MVYPSNNGLRLQTFSNRGRSLNLALVSESRFVLIKRDCFSRKVLTLFQEPSQKEKLVRI